ncbi:MAG TPA: substrate-binding domain-containing protein, partial [Rhodopila sp.]|nr:substrate-binding domain-containing protein [Rhodopila sp.]
RAHSGLRVRIFPTPPGLLLPQLQREIQNDIIVTRLESLDAAKQAGLLTPDQPTGSWRNRLVVAEPARPTGSAEAFAVPDPSPAADFDGAAILRSMGSAPPRIVGVIDTEAVAWLLRHGGARQGLLYQTEVTADGQLRVAAQVPDNASLPIIYAAAVTRLTRRPNPGAFIAFLGSADGQAAFRDAGLESVP